MESLSQHSQPSFPDRIGGFRRSADHPISELVTCPAMHILCSFAAARTVMRTRDTLMAMGRASTKNLRVSMPNAHSMLILPRLC